ncbi:uncharacterized protein LOC113350713 [Papaver somniferum]|uniref:uncharacterized protein LOC113350713 n=1 Tax=Papaver somniferum TaxID=3469 RepID=UPI000E701392|nr:uncharacterized protein LOC113350713 [Papaver somniferum]
MGFGVKWRQWVRCCVEFTRFSVFINGSATGYFKIKKVIRQGDPILSLLFLLVGEALAFMIRRAQEKGSLCGFQVKSNGPLLSHLQFAYDTLIFINADIEQVKNLRLILLSFEFFTGLKLNFAKSQIFGMGYDGNLSVFSSHMGCYSGVLPTTYLGFPLGDKCRGVANGKKWWTSSLKDYMVRLL